MCVRVCGLCVCVVRARAGLFPLPAATCHAVGVAACSSRVAERGTLTATRNTTTPQPAILLQGRLTLDWRDQMAPNRGATL